MKTITDVDYKNLLIQKKSVIDVRASVEFLQGSFPNAVNLPILNDEERALVGTVYKQKGNAEAVKLGHDIVSGENKKQKIQAWLSEIKKNPDILISCFRGGQRSQISQRWISESGFEITRFEKGYKDFRTWTIENLKTFSLENKFKVLSGTTGSGKTKLLKELKNKYPMVDLEGLANHKGSAFGKELTPQPSQADFENCLLRDILIEQNWSQKNILFEDESRMIGSRHLSEEFFAQLRSGSVILMDIPIESRIDNIFYDYVTNTNIVRGTIDEAHVQFEKYIENTNKITKRLGGLRASEIISDLKSAQTDFVENKGLEKNKIWIEKLLVWYYDPLYLGSLEIRKPVVEFQGDEAKITTYLLQS